MKQEWLNKAGNAIRQAMVREQEGLPSPPTCVVFDVSIRNVFDYDQSSNQIKAFLERNNLMMSDVLKAVVQNSLVHYAKLVQQFCSCEVVVKDVRNILVKVPPDSIYKRKVHDSSHPMPELLFIMKGPLLLPLFSPSSS